MTPGPDRWIDRGTSRRTLVATLLASLIAWVGAECAAAGGVRITEVVPERAAATAGLVVGQVLDAWERRDPSGTVVAEGALVDIFDLWQIEVEERPRDGIRVRVADSPDGEGWVELATADWGLDVRAVLPSTPLPTSCQAGESPLDESTARIAAAARQAASVGDDATAECFWRAALDAASVSEPRERALLERAHLEDRFARFSMDRDRYQAAYDHHRSALEARRAADPSSLAVAASLDELGIAAWYLGDRDEVRSSWQEALAIRERETPDSLIVAKSLNNLSLVVDGDERMPLLRRALSIRQHLDPESVRTANLLTNLANTFQRAGDDDAAEPYLRRAEAMLRRVAPERRQLAVVQLALGDMAQRRGHLAEAEDHFRDAASLLERVAPRSFDLADASLQLGDLLVTRWDSERAEVYLRRALDLFDQIAPESPKVVALLTNLGLVAKHRGDPDAARAHYLAAIERGSRGDRDIMRELNVAIATQNLGTLAEADGDLDAAERRYESARARFARVEPDGVDLARTLTNLGQIRLRRGDVKGAERWLRAALAIQDRAAFGSVEQAKSLAGLADVALRRGEVATAEARFRRALDALDADRFLSAGSDVARSRASADTVPIVHAFAAFLIDRGRVAEAFTLGEQARARSFRALLASRDLRFERISPELIAERRRLQAAYDRTLLALGTAEPGTPSAAALRADLEARREAILASTAELARVEPRLGMLGRPDDEAVVTARAALPPGTVVLSYLVGIERGLLFVVTRDDLRAVSIPVGRRALDAEVTAFVEAITRRETLARPRYRRAAETLTARLLEPAAAALDQAEAVIVIPDGPLHRLPFGALVDPSDRQRYWAETTPATLAPSLVGLGELVDRARSERSSNLVAFAVADPLGRGHDAGAAVQIDAVRGAIRAGLDLDPLVHVDREVAALERRFGSGTRAYLDAEATEDVVKRLDASTRVVHFATHAWVDDRFPLESGLVLAIPSRLKPGRDNGVLQAWEIVEQLRLNADLVTLSGCRTGLGRAYSGEGMLGLTRAFQLAGARAVLASLWPVNDASTSTLMARFYDHLHQGQSAGEALRAAQLDLVAAGSGTDAEGGVDLARPYHWAGFQLFGDGTSTWTTAP